MVERKIVFVTDFDGDVDRGLRLATAHASEHAATLVILHVVPMRSEDGEGLLHRGLDLLHGRPLYRLRSLVPTDPGVPYQHVLEFGDPEDQIVRYLEREPVDLVVVEARARGFLDRLRSRSLDVGLRRRVQCPVLSYRTEQGAVPVRSVTPTLLDQPAGGEALQTVLEARVDALQRWLSSRRRDVREISERRSVRDAAAGLARTTGLFSARVRQLLELELEEHRRALGACGFQLRFLDGDSGVGLGRAARESPALEEFLDRVRRDGAAVSLPMDPEPSAAATDHLILAAATMQIPGLAPAFLVFSFEARRDFLRILAQPGPCPTFETYAFDGDGMMLSNSRFPEQLRRLGLLPPEPGVQATGQVRVCDPGGHWLAGEVAPSDPRPLTRMASAAVAGQDGWDWDGYRDYRGVRVVGAWRWIAEYGFGVAAEMDHPGQSAVG